MTDFDSAEFFTAALVGHVEPMIFAGFRPVLDIPNSHYVTLKLDPAALEQLDPGLRSHLQEVADKPLDLMVSWVPERQHLNLLARIAHFTNTPEIRAIALDVVNRENNHVGPLTRLSISEDDTHLILELAAAQVLPLPEHPDVAQELVRHMVKDFLAECSAAGSLFVAQMQHTVHPTRGH